MKEAAVKYISTNSPFEKKMSYSRAIVKGDWCFVAGVTGYDYEAMRMPDSVGAQSENCFKTIDFALGEAGFCMADIVRVRYILVDASLVDAVAPVLRKYLNDIRPAATLIIAGLLKAEMKIEIEVTAFKG